MCSLISYIPTGTCSRKIDIRISENVVESVKFFGGCPGNLEGLNLLISGMEIRDVVEKIEGVRCGSRSTSCPDQLARALREYLENEPN